VPCFTDRKLDSKLNEGGSFRGGDHPEELSRNGPTGVGRVKKEEFRSPPIMPTTPAHSGGRGGGGGVPIPSLLRGRTP